MSVNKPGNSQEEQLETKLKKEVANSFGQFLKVQKANLKAINPAAKLDFEKILIEWGEVVSDEEKKMYKKMSEEDKKKLGDNYRRDIDRLSKDDLKAKETDRERKRKERMELKSKQVDEEYCSSKFRSILCKKRQKCRELTEENSRLEEQLLELTRRDEELKRRNDHFEYFWKPKYKVLYEQHEMCSKP